MEQHERISFFGGLRMTLDWIPGVVIGLGAGALNWWRGSAVEAEQVTHLQTEIARVEANSKERIGRIEADSREFQKQVHAEMNETLQKWNNLITRIEVLTTEQTAFTRIATNTLQGISRKLETHDSLLVKHTTEIAILKARGGDE